MTGGVESASATRRGVLSSAAAPALVLLATVAAFLRFHQYDLLLPESLLLIALTTALGAALGALAGLRPQTLEPAAIAGALGFYVIHTPVLRNWIGPASEQLASLTGDAHLPRMALTVGFCLTVFLLCFLARAHLRGLAIAVFGTIVLTTLALPTATGGEPVTTGAVPQRLADLPPVVHIILDEHIGLDGLPEDMAGSPAAAAAIRASYADFALYSRAYSRFAETMHSLAALMNGQSGPAAAKLPVDAALGYSLPENRWFAELKRRGYAVSVYQTDWLDLCASPAVDRCYTYPMFSPNPVQRTGLSTPARLRVLVAKLFLSDDVLQLSAIGSDEALAQFGADLASAPRGVAYVLHLLTPHSNYVFDAGCRIIDPAGWRHGPEGRDLIYGPDERRALYGLYLPQLVCASERIAAMLDGLKALGVYDEATVIVHGDHGSRLAERPFLHTPADKLTDRDVLDHYSTLLAIKMPGTQAGIRTEPALLQDAFADLVLGAAADTGGIAPGDVLVRTGKATFDSRRIVWPATGADTPEIAAARGAAASAH